MLLLVIVGLNRIGMGLNLYDWKPYKERKFGHSYSTEIEPRNQKKLGVSGNQKSRPKVREDCGNATDFGEGKPCQYLAIELAYETETINSCCVSKPACDTCHINHGKLRQSWSDKLMQCDNG